MNRADRYAADLDRRIRDLEARLAGPSGADDDDRSFFGDGAWTTINRGGGVILSDTSPVTLTSWLPLPGTVETCLFTVMGWRPTGSNYYAATGIVGLCCTESELFARQTSTTSLHGGRLNAATYAWNMRFGGSPYDPAEFQVFGETGFSSNWNVIIRRHIAGL